MWMHGSTKKSNTPPADQPPDPPPHNAPRADPARRKAEEPIWHSNVRACDVEKTNGKEVRSRRFNYYIWRSWIHGFDVRTNHFDTMVREDVDMTHHLRCFHEDSQPVCWWVGCLHATSGWASYDLSFSFIWSRSSIADSVPAAHWCCMATCSLLVLGLPSVHRDFENPPFILGYCLDTVCPVNPPRNS